MEHGRNDEHLDRRGFLAWLAGGMVAGAAVAAGVSGVRQAYALVVEPLVLRLPGLARPLRVAFATDLHYGPFIRARQVAAWVDAIRDMKPDLIVLGGDVVDQRASHNLDRLFIELARLRAPMGVYAVLGNHEYRHARGPRAFLAGLRSIGVTPLVNDGLRLDGGLYLAGVDDHRHGAPDVPRSLRDRLEGAPTLLVSHNPDLLPTIPTTVHLTLCGHTHGGQVRFPGIGPLFTSSAYGRRFASGPVEAPARGYVSRGLGVGLVPVRWNCPPELTALTLLPG